MDRTHRFVWDGQPYEQQERFFVGRTTSPTITLEGCGEAELAFLSEWRWWSVEEIAESGAVLAPRTR